MNNINIRYKQLLVICFRFYSPAMSSSSSSSNLLTSKTRGPSIHHDLNPQTPSSKSLGPRAVKRSQSLPKSLTEIHKSVVTSKRVRKNDNLIHSSTVLRQSMESITTHAKSMLNSNNKEVRSAALSIVKLTDTANNKLTKISPDGCRAKYVAKRLDTVKLAIPDRANNLPLRQLSVRVKRPPPRLPTSLLKVNDQVSVPFPLNKRMYTALEAVEILIKIKNNRNAVIATWIKYNYIPIKRTQMQELIKKHNPSQIENTVWKIRGRPPIMPINKILSFHNEFNQQKGRALSVDDIKVKLMFERNNEMEKKGYSSVTSKVPCKETAQNYFATIAALNPACGVVEKIQQKTHSRYTGENSIRNAISFLVIVARAHLFVGEIPNRITTKKVEHATDGAKMLEKLVSEANNDAPVSPVYPWLITSTDDTTVFIFKGTACNKKKLFIVPEKMDKHKSNYSNDMGGTDHLNGIRVRHTYSMNAMGNLAPIYITVTGMNEREMPVDTCPEGIFVMKVKGLVFGGTQDIRHRQSLGYVVFMRNQRDKTGKTNEQLNFSYYRDKIFDVWIDQLREEYGENFNRTMHVPEEYTCVSWQDGGGTQLAAIVDPVYQDKNAMKRKIDCKHASSTSATTQPCDIQSGFMTSQALNKIVTCADLPNSGYKGSIISIFQIAENEKKLSLKATQREAIVDHLVCFPSIVTRSHPIDGVMQGFITNGMLDKKTKNWPDMNEMLGTCRRKLTTDEVDLVKKHFKYLYNVASEDGYIPDTVYDELGFIPDVNFNKEEVRKNPQITNESQQRAKELSHIVQKSLRKHKLEETKLNRDKQLADQQLTISQHLEKNSLCEKIVKGDQEGRELKDVSMNDFDKKGTLSALLKGFIFVRLFSNHQAPRGQANKIPKNKGKLEDAERGVKNLIRIAWDLRENPILLKAVERRNENETANTENISSIQNDTHTSVIELNEISEKKKSSDYLNNITWRENVIKSLGGVIQTNTNTEEVNTENTNKLVIMLSNRFAKHLRLRFKDETYHNHYSMEFVKDNINVMSAVLTLYGHAKKDIGKLHFRSCLITHPRNKLLFAKEGNERLEGCYLMYDKEEHIWVRSGKACGSKRSDPPADFGNRMESHLKSAINTQSSHFYKTYPSKHNKNQNNQVRNGYFEDLDQYVGLGFDKFRHR